MMKKWLFITMILVFHAGVHAQNLPEILPVLAGFDRAVESHSPKKVLKFMDADYALEQHDQMLQGNTVQFVDELLSGYTSPDEGTYLSVHQKDVVQIDLYEMIHLDDSSQVIWKLLLKNGQIVYSTMWMKLNRKTGKYGIVGAVG